MGVAVYSLLGGKVRDQVKAEWSIWRSQSASELVEEARWAVAEGHEYLEVKVGGGLDLGSDIERVQAVRDAVGSNVKIKADFNQGYLGEGGSAAQFNAVLRFVEALGHRTLDYIEQPLPYWDLDGLVALRRKINVPIILDESIYDPQSLSEVVKRGAADAAHLKVIKGGFLKLQEMIAIADAAGLTIIPGEASPPGWVLQLFISMWLPSLPYNMAPTGRDSASLKRTSSRGLYPFSRSSKSVTPPVLGLSWMKRR